MHIFYCYGANWADSHLSIYRPSRKEHNGAYFVDSNAVPPESVRAWARDSVEAARLWKLSEEIVGQKFTY